MAPLQIALLTQVAVGSDADITVIGMNVTTSPASIANHNTRMTGQPVVAAEGLRLRGPRCRAQLCLWIKALRCRIWLSRPTPDCGVAKHVSRVSREHVQKLPRGRPSVSVLPKCRDDVLQTLWYTLSWHWKRLMLSMRLLAWRIFL